MKNSLTPLDYFTRRIEDMRSERSSWISHWRDLTDNFSPRRGKFAVTDRNKGNKRNFLINNTPLFARRVMVAGMMTGITSPARPWFRLQPPDPDMATFTPVRQWLELYEKMMYKIFAKSNLYRTLPIIYEDAGVIGTAAMIQEEDFDDISRFTPFSAGEYMLDIDSRNRINTFAREFQLTVAQTVDRFGLEKVSTVTKTNYDNANYSAWVSINHIIEPVALNQHPDLKIDKKFKYRSVYYEVSKNNNKNLLSVKGYRNFPIIAPRWDAKSGDVYGFSPGMDALGDARALQVQEREKGKAVAKMVSPPTKAPSALRNSNLSLLPGANTFTDDPSNVFSPIYQVNPKVNELGADIQLTEDRINRAFYVDLFLLISRQQDIRSATEIAARQEEKLLQLGPVLENMHNELLDPLIDNTFARLIQLSEPGWKGTGPELLPPPPPALQGAQLRVEYVSTLAQAQKIIATGAVKEWTGFVGQLAAISPSVIDKINSDNIADEMAQDLGVPVNSVNSDEAVKQIRDQRQQAQDQQQRQQQALMALDAAKTMGDTSVAPGNILSDVVGLGQKQ